MNFKYIITLLLLFTMLSGAIPEGYYNGTEGKNGPELQSALHKIIRGHTRRSYDYVLTAIEQTDEDPENSNNVILLYTGRSQEKAYRDQGTSVDYSQYDGGNGTYNDSWNREHVWPKSHGFPNESDTAYTDIHHLRPTDRTVNSSRGTKDFDWGDTWHTEATECKVSSNAWEPRDAVKGDVARMVFYMTVRYENTGNYNLEMVDYIPTDENTPYLGKKSTLLSWHASDPVDEFERNRNDVTYSLQGNRNPFIDHPEYAEAIWGNAPNSPANLIVSNITDTSMRLDWTDQSADEEGFNIYVNGNLNKTVGENITTTTVSQLLPGISYTFGVTAYNTAGESSAATETAITTGGMAGPVYISEYADALGTGNYIYEYVEIHNFGTSVYDASNYIISQTASDQSFTFPPSTIIPAKGFLIIGRNASMDDFEAFWDVTLGSQVVYINSGNTIPLINGDEQYRLVDVSDSAVDPDDGFTALVMPSSAGKRIYRLSTGNTLSDWAVTNWDLATPGSLDEDQSLPVTLSSFTAKVAKGTVVLEWETSSEIENQGFVLSRKSKVESQKSEIIADFSTDDALKGQGTTTETTKYAFTDKSVEPGKTYVYTLADVDYAGVETILEKVEVKPREMSEAYFTGEAESGVVADAYTLNPVYPNPFNATLTIPFTLTEPMTVSIELYSLTGRRMMTIMNRDFDSGSYNQMIQVDDLASGIYLIRTSFSGRIYVQKAALLK